MQLAIRAARYWDKAAVTCERPLRGTYFGCRCVRSWPSGPLRSQTVNVSEHFGRGLSRWIRPYSVTTHTERSPAQDADVVHFQTSIEISRVAALRRIISRCPFREGIPK